MPEDNTPPPPSDTPPRQTAKQVREKLSHFQYMEDGGTEEIRESFLTKLSNKLEDWQKRGKGGDQLHSAQQSAGKVVKRVSSHPKWIIGGIVVVILILLAVFVLPVIPLQLQRSSGFAALEAGDYRQAYDNLSAYLSERPNDNEAAQKMAHAAIRIGDIAHAQSALNKLSVMPAFAGSPEYLYDIAVVYWDKPGIALPALDNLLSQRADHVPGLLLRGLLLSGDKDSFRKAREDMLRADDIIRAGRGALREVVFLNRYLYQNGFLLFPFSAAIDGAPPENSPPSKLWGFNTNWDGYINRYQNSTGAAFLDEQLTARTITHLYYAYALMRQNEFDEAESEIRSALADAPNSPNVKQAEAMLLARRGDNADAAARFEALVQQTDDAQTLNNLAVAKWAMLPRLDDAAAIIRFYADSLKTGGDDLLAFNNIIFFNLMRGDIAAAAEQMSRPISAAATDSSPQLKLNRASLDAWNGDLDKALQLLSSISAESVPHIALYVAVLESRRGEYENALAVLQTAEQSFPQDEDISLLLARLLIQRGEQWAAHAKLKEFLTRRPKNAEARYLFAKIALELDDGVLFEQQKIELEKNIDARTRHYLDALQAAEFIQQGNLQGAVDAYRRAIRAAPLTREKQEYAVEWGALNAKLTTGDNAEVTEVLTSLLGEQFNAEIAAVLSYAQAIEGAPGARDTALAAQKSAHSETAQKFLGAALTKIGDIPAAMPLLIQALRRRPNDAFALNALHDAQQKADLRDDAEVTQKIMDYLTAISEGRGPVERVKYNIAAPNNNALAKKLQLALNPGGGAAALKDALRGYATELEKAETTETKAQLMLSRATFQVYLEDYDAAAADFQAAIAFGLPEENLQNALLIYARVLTEQGQNTAAAETLKQVVDLAPDTPLYRRLRAQAIANDGDINGASNILKTLIKNYPADFDSYYELAKLQYQQEKHADAAQTLRALTRVAPNFSEAYKLLAASYAARENKKMEDIYTRVYSELNNQ